MKAFGILSMICLGLSLATIGSDLSTWACNAAIVCAILCTYNPPPQKE